MLARYLCLSLCAVTLAGCATASSSNTARTATEQLLISNAIDHSISKVDFAGLAGQRVFLDDKYLESVDKNYIVASVRHRLMLTGVTLADDAKEADVVLEVRSGGVGTDTAETFYGFPEVVIPGMVTLPELKVATRDSQRGSAKLGFVAYDAKTSQMIGDGGVAIAVSDHNRWNVLGVGPFKNGTLREELTAVARDQTFNPASGHLNHVAFDGHQPDDANRIRLTGGTDE